MKTALAALTKRPDIATTAEDHIQHFQTYQTPNLTDCLNDACVAADGSIIRCYISRGGSSSTCYVQRITDPSIASQWTTWTALAGGAIIFADGGVAVSKWPDNSLHVYAQQGTGGNAIYNWYSTNNGATWAGPGSIASPPGGALTRGIGSAGNSDVFFLYDVTGGDAMGCCFYSGNIWSVIHTWPYAPLQYGQGLAPVWVAATSSYWIPHSDGYGLYNVEYTPGTNTWTGAPTAIAPATSTALGRISPRIFYDAATALYNLAVIEYDSGIITQSVYNYPRIRQSSDMIHWSNGIPRHTLSSFYNCTPLYVAAPQTGSSGARYYYICAASVLSAQQYSQSNTNQYLDVSAAVLSYTRHEVPGKPAKLTLVLDNADGQYNNNVNLTDGNAQDPYRPIGKNTSIKLNEGYYTGSPPTASDTILVGTYHLTIGAFHRTPEQNYVLIVADDLTRNLDLEARFQNTYINNTLQFLVIEVCARAGLGFTNFNANCGSQLTQVIPTFTIKAGQTYRRALNELCQTYGLAYFLDQTETMQFMALSTSDASIWSYTPEWETIVFGTAETRANHIVVSGKPPTGGTVGALTTAESYDDTSVQDTNIERLLHYVDTKLITVTQCALKAAFLMTQEQRSELADSFLVPANPALQLYDVVTLTDGNNPGSGRTGTARLDSITVKFDAEKAEYSLTATAEGV